MVAIGLSRRLFVSMAVAAVPSVVFVGCGSESTQNGSTGSVANETNTVAGVDEAPTEVRPSVTIESPRDRKVVKGDTVVVSGRAVPEYARVKVEILTTAGGQESPSEVKTTYAEAGRYSVRVPMPRGSGRDKTILVTLVGDGSVVETRTVFAPRRKPKKRPRSGGDCITVPNVVGKDHQAAQNTMQANGFFLLQEEDATGAGRLLLYDRNWTTVRQQPAAGTCVSPDSEITLFAVKDDE